MTTTTNYGLKKIDDSDNWRTIGDDHNDSMDIVDTQLKAANDRIVSAQDGLGILANGNTHAAIANGQAVFVRNHGSLADGLYWATAAIAANAALSTSNLTDDTSGGLNKLHDDITTLNSNFTNAVYYKTVTIPMGTAGTSWSPTARDIGEITSLLGLLQVSLVSIISYDTALTPASNLSFGMYGGHLYGSASQTCTLESDLNLKIGFIK